MHFSRPMRSVTFRVLLGGHNTIKYVDLSSRKDKGIIFKRNESLEHRCFIFDKHLW